MFDLQEYVADLYDEFINDQRGRGVWNVDDAWFHIEPQLKTALQQGLIDLDVNQIGREALRAADRSVIDHGRRVLQKERKRVGWMSIDDGAWLDVLVRLGKNDRCQMGEFGYDEYEKSIALKVENIEAAKHELNEHVLFLEPYVPHMKNGMRMRSIYSQYFQR